MSLLDPHCPPCSTWIMLEHSFRLFKDAKLKALLCLELLARVSYKNEADEAFLNSKTIHVET